MNSNLVITIGREYGSGGREIGETLAKNWGLSGTTNNSSSYPLRKADLPSRSLKSTMKPRRTVCCTRWSQVWASASPIQPLSVQLYLEQFKAIREIADKESCVLITAALTTHCAIGTM